ncbi:MAG: hypothetical protein AB7J28_05080 [Hyphomonadaceae bacterium]
MDRKTWREQWLDSLTEISALNWQRRNWGALPNPHYTWSECIECYFSDALRGGGYEELVSAGLLSFDEAFAVAEMHLRLDAFVRGMAVHGRRDHHTILSDPAWIGVTEAARRARRQLLKLITEKNEREVLLRAEPENP